MFKLLIYSNSKICLIVGFLAWLSFESTAQNITNAGSEFWFAYTEMRDTDQADYEVKISSENTTSGTVSIPGTGFSQNFSISPGAVATVVIPPVDAWITGSDTIVQKGIKVISEEDIVVYASSFRNFRSEVSLVLPVSALGNSYRVMSYSSEIKSNVLYRSELTIVAAGNQVDVEITPSANTAGGNLAGVPYIISLDTDEVYQLQADSVSDDLTGTLIRTLNPDDVVAVYSGNQWSTIFCAPNSDPIFEVLFPISSWGDSYIIIPTPQVTVDVFRVMAAENSTQVFKDGLLLATLNAGEFIEDTLQSAKLITSNKPISIGAFMVTGGAVCAGLADTDPSMIMINPNEQMFLTDITFFALNRPEFDQHWVNIVTRTADTASLLLDGVGVNGFQILNQDSVFSYTSVQIDTGSHQLTTTGCGFLAYSIGMGFAVSYAYAAGVLLTNLEAGVDFENITALSDTICNGDSLLFSVSTSGQPISYNWIFGDGSSSATASPVHKYDATGQYFIEVEITYQCAIDTVYDTLNVVAYPKINITPDTVVCLADTLQLSVDTGAIAYLWSTGSTINTTIVDSTDFYYVTVSNLRCSSSDSMYVEFAPVANTISVNSDDPMDSLCVGNEVFLSAFSSDTLISSLWTFGDGGQTTELITSHIYEVDGSFQIVFKASYACGNDTIEQELFDQVVVNRYPELSIPNDTSVCEWFTIFNPVSNPVGSFEYIWSPEADSDSGYAVSSEGLYMLKVENIGCNATDSFSVDFGAQLNIGNVFTPNGDGVNDLFRPGGSIACFDYDLLSIYNRWGGLVFRTNMPLSEGWDGYTLYGEKATNGVYFYTLEGEGGYRNGSFTLLTE